MKRAMIVTGSIALVVLALLVCLSLVLTAPKFKGNFSISDYQAEMDNPNFWSDVNYGTIKDFEIAARVGKQVIANRFEDSMGGIFAWMGCAVQYDAENDVYFVRTYPLLPLIAGGAYDVILQTDGTVLAVWGEK